MIEYVLNAETPAKKNSKIMNTKTHRMFPSKRYQEWHDYASLKLRPVIKECINEPCYIIMTFCHGDNRHRDSDNGVSSIFDMLVDLKALEDDCWQLVKSHHVFNCYKKGDPFCKIRIYKESEKDLFIKDVISLYN